ncbi:uncharacterized protein TRIADDRAFT_28240 [Trichoplax adhaerens]|uniref:RING-type domain-containing protein n=1 Tax=Trichoplax adhaerens TaxID=10228 RepID=B3S391_TRIAD|nr:hypothetical protein TRIADDRAFT_28240 [Trichoplax adhaerens]EDV22748.1 hypothetical protein TRIADDRAFT_28240 [Trichoplax adhaerens]|eukprot:XP_002114614.1 hypothetical protein TRIADDRAFT_28240 [Trichoplax adhaerens]
MKRTLALKELNPCLTCSLCDGYLVNATTVVECLHTFCKSCIVKHLEDSNNCPKCDNVVHQSHPLQYISYDRTMQDLVYKLVPGLQERELETEREFYESRGLRWPKKRLSDSENENSPAKKNKSANSYSNDACDYHRADEQIAIILECKKSNGYNLDQLHRKFLLCSVQATVMHLKKFVAKKLQISKPYELEILCNDEILGKDHTLKFICLTRWRNKETPLVLHYQPRENYDD